MNVKFDNLPDNSRIWIYPSNRPFSKTELETLTADLSKFLAQWTAHNQNLQAGFELPYNRFIVIGVNQQAVQASGCSIDSSIRFIQDLESKYGVTPVSYTHLTLPTNREV